MPERNPFEETRQAAQDWSSRDGPPSQMNPPASDRSVNYFRPNIDIRPNIDGGISNVSNVNDRSLFQGAGSLTSLDNPNSWFDTKYMAPALNRIVNKHGLKTDQSYFQNMINEGYGQTDNSSSLIPSMDWKNKMLNWNLGNWDIGIGQGKFNLGLNVPLGQSAALDTGLGSTDEYQMAELTPKQQEWMRSLGATPDFISPDYSYKHVQDIEDKGFFGWGAQEPTTREEFDEYYNYLLANPELTSWQT